MADLDQAELDAAALAAQRIDNIDPLRVPKPPYQPTAKDKKEAATVAAVILFAEDVGAAMAHLDAKYRVRISTLEKRVSDLAKQLEAKP